MIVFLNNNKPPILKYNGGGYDLSFNNKTEIIGDLAKNTNTNTALAFLKTIYNNINTDQDYYNNEYTDFEKTILTDTTEQKNFKNNILPNTKLILKLLLDTLRFLKTNDNWDGGYIDFNSVDFNTNSYRNEPDSILKMLWLTSAYVNFMIQMNNSYKASYGSSGNLQEKIHKPLWKKFDLPDNRIQGKSNNPTYLCRLPTRDFVPTNEIYSSNNNILYKMNSEYMRFYKYMIDSAPKVGNIYGDMNYKGLQNLYNNNPDTRIQQLYLAFNGLEKIAKDFNAIINILKNEPTSWNNQNITNYNNLLNAFLTKTQEIYIIHDSIYKTNIWLIHEPKLWVAQPFQGPESLFICRYKKITDDVFF